MALLPRLEAADAAARAEGADTLDLVLFRAQHEALIVILGRKMGARMLREMADRLSAPSDKANIFEIRGGAETDATARIAAAAWYRDAMPKFVSRLVDG